MIRSLYAGLSGLRNHQTQLDVIGNNISNLNTVGFKSGRVLFEEMLPTTLKSPIKPTEDRGGSNPVQIGVGSQVGSITTLFSQGGIQATGKQTDLALQGTGFFIVSDGARKYYTRDGSFQFDSIGRLVSSTNGMVLQGKMANAKGELPSSTYVEDIQLSYGLEVPANPTTTMELAGNLNAAAESLGSINESKAIYGIELTGDSSDVNGLFATGQSNSQISGMSVGSTTVTVTANTADGSVTNTYTYTNVDMGPDDQKFNSLDDLVAEINGDFENSMSVSINSAGQLVFENLLTGEVVDPETGDITSEPVQNNLFVNSSNSILKRALASLNGNFTESMESDKFAHVADADDLLTNLRNFEGQDFGLDIGDSVKLNGTIGGDLIDQSSLVLTEISTYQDLIDKINATFQINNDEGAQINSQNGAIRIVGDGGTKYGIADLNFRAFDEADVEKTEFGDIFNSAPGNWLSIQEATDAEHATSITVYDSLGYAHQLSVTFTKDTAVANKWNWVAQVGEPASLASGTSGIVTFNSDGSLRSFEYDGGVTSLSFDPGTGADNPISISIDVGEPGTYDGIAQFEAVSTAVITDQDGFPMGKLETVTFDQSGIVVGIFSNGETQTLAKIALATFTNESGLTKTGNNMFLATNNSGSPVVGEAGVNVDATITPGAVELSNVELSTEFANMITAQRGYQANARLITTADAILDETIGLKR